VARILKYSDIIERCWMTGGAKALDGAAKRCGVLRNDAVKGKGGVD